MFRQRVLPILSESDVAHDVVVTSRAGEARELLSKEDLRRWSAVVIVSGDGLLYEVSQCDVIGWRVTSSGTRAGARTVLCHVL